MCFLALGSESEALLGVPPKNAHIALVVAPSLSPGAETLKATSGTQDTLSPSFTDPDSNVSEDFTISTSRLRY